MELGCPGFKCKEALNKKWAPFLLIDSLTARDATKDGKDSMDSTANVNTGANTDYPERLKVNLQGSSSSTSGLLGRFRRARMQRFIGAYELCWG